MALTKRRGPIAYQLDTATEALIAAAELLVEATDELIDVALPCSKTEATARASGNLNSRLIEFRREWLAEQTARAEAR